jgi:hypothetical protein
MPGTSEETEAEAERLMVELVDMGRRDPHPGGELFAAFLEEDLPRTREIGARLYALGGHRLMLHTHDRIEREAPAYSSEHLRHAWDGVGMWMA